jgi:hypothetical protein
MAEQDDSGANVEQWKAWPLHRLDENETHRAVGVRLLVPIDTIRACTAHGHCRREDVSDDEA